MPRLTEQKQQEIIRYREAYKPLPGKYQECEPGVAQNCHQCGGYFRQPYHDNCGSDGLMVARSRK